VPSPVKNPGAVDMVIFRENTEDIYAGIEFEQGSDDVKIFFKFIKREFPETIRKNPFSGNVGYRYKTGVAGRHGTTDPFGYRVCHCQ